jgi:hypothetical protein
VSAAISAAWAESKDAEESAAATMAEPIVWAESAIAWAELAAEATGSGTSGAGTAGTVTVGAVTAGAETAGAVTLAVGAVTLIPCAKADAVQNIASNRAILIFFIPFFSCFAIMVRKGVRFATNIEFFSGLVKFFLLFLNFYPKMG